MTTQSPAFSPVREWYVFCSGPLSAGNLDRVGGDGRSGEVVHAKVMGVHQAACGVSCMSWPKYFDWPFDEHDGNRCPTCVEVLAAGCPDHWTGAYQPSAPQPPSCEPPAVDEPQMHLTVHPTHAGWAWSLTATNNRVVARAPSRWTSRIAAHAAALKFCERAGTATIDLECTEVGMYEWRLLTGGEVIALSGGLPYAGRASARTGAERVRARAKGAVLQAPGRAGTPVG